MKKVTLFAAAAAVSALIATPVLAGTTGKHMKTSHMKQHHASKSHMRHHARGDHMHHNRMAYRDQNGGFWPGAVVGGAIGTAGAVAATTVGTAGAVAAAPFGGPYYGNSYAYSPGYANTYNYDGIAIPNSANYDARNGFSCQPGTFIKNTRTICQ